MRAMWLLAAALLLAVMPGVNAGAQTPGYEIRVVEAGRKMTIEVVDAGQVRSKITARFFEASKSLEVKSEAVSGLVKKYVRKESDLRKQVSDLRKQVEEIVFRDLGKSGPSEKAVADDIVARLYAHFWNTTEAYQPPSQGRSPIGQSEEGFRNTLPVYRPVFIPRATVTRPGKTADSMPMPGNPGTNNPPGRPEPPIMPPAIPPPTAPPPGNPPDMGNPTNPPVEQPRPPKWEIERLGRKQTARNQTVAGNPAPGATAMEIDLHLRKGELRVLGTLRLAYRNAQFGPEYQVWTISSAVQQQATPQAPGLYMIPQNPRAFCPVKGNNRPADDLNSALWVALWKAYDPPVESLDRWTKAILTPQILRELGL